jgi:hypothetical protein
MTKKRDDIWSIIRAACLEAIATNADSENFDEASARLDLIADGAISRIDRTIEELL